MNTQKPKLVLDDVREVDDAAGTHNETILTGKQIVDLIDYRARLAADQPCPLCGSCTHPAGRS